MDNFSLFNVGSTSPAIISLKEWCYTASYKSTTCFMRSYIIDQKYRNKRCIPTVYYTKVYNTGTGLSRPVGCNSRVYRANATKYSTPSRPFFWHLAWKLQSPDSHDPCRHNWGYYDIRDIQKTIEVNQVKWDYWILLTLYVLRDVFWPKKYKYKFELIFRWRGGTMISFQHILKCKMDVWFKIRASNDNRKHHNSKKYRVRHKVLSIEKKTVY